MTDSIGRLYLEDAVRLFESYKALGDKAMAQVSDEAFFHALDEESNSIAIVVKHIAGNMRSRWTDFLTTDGEKPDRNRDSEFEDEATTREELMRRWEDGWRLVFATLASLGEEDLRRTVTIRAEEHTVLKAINRQVAHYAYHVGQIVFLAKHFAGGEWRTLSVARGGTTQFNREMFGKAERAR